LRTAKSNKDLDVNLDQQVAAARAQVLSAQATADLARQSLADATIRSPFTGRVAGKPVQVGTVLSPGAPVARLIGSSGVYFEGEVPESQIAEIMPGKPVSVRFDALPGQSFGGSVVAINPLGDSVGRLFKVRISLAGLTESVRPGMFARGQIQLRMVPSATVVPKTAVRTEGNETFVFVLEGGVAKKRPVVMGIEKDDIVQITNVRGGEQIITKGQFDVKDGDKVKLDTQDPGEAAKVEN
jgi:RND family efflux transporter MFP subunit